MDGIAWNKWDLTERVFLWIYDEVNKWASSKANSQSHFTLQFIEFIMLDSLLSFLHTMLISIFSSIWTQNCFALYFCVALFAVGNLTIYATSTSSVKQSEPPQPSFLFTPFSADRHFMLSLIAASNNTLVTAGATAASSSITTSGTERTQAIISPTCITTSVVARIAVAAANVSAAVAVMPHPSM